MADEKMVTVALKRTYRKGATNYGPGEAVQMPESLAAGLGLLSPAAKEAAKEAKATAKAEAKSTKKGGK